MFFEARSPACAACSKLRLPWRRSRGSAPAVRRRSCSARSTRTIWRCSFTHALLEGRPGDPAAILAAMAAITDARAATQPVNTRTGGSTFANPPGAKAWELIDRAGCRGLTVGAAQVSELHCNFLVNLGGATAAHIERPCWAC